MKLNQLFPKRIHVSFFSSGLITTIISILFVFYVCYLLWMSLGPVKPTLNYVRRCMADLAVNQMLEEIRKNRGDIRSVELLHFANDPTDYFSNALRMKLNTTGILNVEDVSFVEKLRNKMNLRNRGCASFEEALKCADSDAVDGVLWGELETFESHQAGVALTGAWQLVDVKTKNVVYAGMLSFDTAKTAALNKVMDKGILQVEDSSGDLCNFFQYTASFVPWHVRFLGFVLLTLLLPIVTITFVRTMVAKRSNKVNAFMLGIYTLIDAIFAFFMIGGAFCSSWVVFLFLIAVALAFIYNVSLMNFALKLES